MEIREEKEFENEDDTIKGFLYQCSDEQGKCHYPNKMPEYIDIMAFGCPECESELISYLFDLESWVCHNCGRILDWDIELNVIEYNNKFWLNPMKFQLPDEDLQLRWCSNDELFYLFGFRKLFAFETELEVFEALEYLSKEL